MRDDGGVRASARRGAPGRRLAVASLFALALGAAGAAAQVTPLAGPDGDADLVLEGEALLAFEPLSLEDVLRHVLGVVVSRRGAVGSLEYLNVAGSTSGRVRLSLDGIELEEPELAFARLYAIPIALVDRLDVHRGTDPVRIEVWTKPSTVPSAVTEIDLGRGDYTTRIRRLQFLLPPRSWWVGARYDELLRGRHDFLTAPPDTDTPHLGEYDGRGRTLILGFQRAGGERLRLLLADHFDNAHGSYAGPSELSGQSRVLGSLRWWRPLGGLDLVADVSQQAWERSRQFVAATTQVTESHARVALDLALPATQARRGALRLRATDVSAERQDGSGVETQRFQRYDAELQAGTNGALSWQGWAGLHRRSSFGTDWSARLLVEQALGEWVVRAQGGRGVTFAGWGETRAAGDDGRRSGLHAAAGLRRPAGATTLGLWGYTKRLEGRSGVAGVLFPSLGAGPARLAGLLVDAGLAGGAVRFPWSLRAELAWTPWVEGDRSGLPEIQAALQAQVAAVQLFAGDLLITFTVRGRYETQRRFTDSVELATYGAGDARLDFRVLQRLLVYWDVQNVGDTAYETYPGVLVPGRSSLVGVRVELFD